jgi:hypothetical protein
VSGGAGPFELQTFADIKAHVGDMIFDIGSNKMPYLTARFASDASCGGVVPATTTAACLVKSPSGSQGVCCNILLNWLNAGAVGVPNAACP